LGVVGGVVERKKEGVREKGGRRGGRQKKEKGKRPPRVS